MLNERTEFINDVIRIRGYKNYLEIGASERNNFDEVIIDSKICVDPDQKLNATYKITSDEYFKTLNPTFLFDIIFIDGLHETKQVDRDIENSLNHLAPKGIILCHDTLPELEVTQQVPRESYEYAWYGDVWKSILKLRMRQSDLNIVTVRMCTGITMITKSKKEQPLYTANLQHDYLFSWDYYVDNKEKFMNVVSKEQMHNYLGNSK